ncbi:uncharacterized protein [Haliotis cracherodii]|uniref:uncharacterized protein n=1 Tax=Haliotis cracherodii TaxID=6455 RepID=UPI0039E92DED
MSIDIVDLEDIVTTFFFEEWMEDKKKKDADRESVEIKWDRVRFTHSPAKYVKDEEEKNGDEEGENGEDADPEKRIAKGGNPNAHVIFTAFFANNTEAEQVHTLTTERRTKSTCTVSLSKAYTLGASVNIRITPPNPIVEANAGFKAEMSKMKGLSETVEKELTWSVNSQIKIPKKSRTRVDLVIKEEEYDGRFTMDTKIEGNVIITAWTKNRDKHVSSANIKVASIFAKNKYFKVDKPKNAAVFVTQGNCKCRFGIEQNMEQTELPLLK